MTARQLVWSLADREITQIVSSPLARCVETVVPIAASRGLAVDSGWELGPDSLLEGRDDVAPGSARDNARVYAPRDLRAAPRVGRALREGRDLGAREERERARPDALRRGAHRASTHRQVV
jgi:broad specificity phosphatase PhoE